ncbi:hypothetical protein Pcac1_g17419, partial [Phytophthora cactorum]
TCGLPLTGPAPPDGQPPRQRQLSAAALAAASASAALADSILGRLSTQRGHLGTEQPNRASGSGSLFAMLSASA